MAATRRSLLAWTAVAAGGPLNACATGPGRADPLEEAHLAEARGRAGAVPRGMGRVWMFGRRIAWGLPSVVLDGQEVYEPAASEAALETPFAVFRDVPPGKHRVVTGIKGTDGSGDALAFAVAPGEERFVNVHAFYRPGTMVPMWIGGVGTGPMLMQHGAGQFRFGARLVDPEAGRAAAARKAPDRPRSAAPLR